MEKAVHHSHGASRLRSSASGGSAKLPLSDADAGVQGARVPLSQQVAICVSRWHQQLPEFGAVSLAEMHRWAHKLSPSSRSAAAQIPNVLRCAARFQWHDSDTHGRRQQPAEGWASWNDNAVAPGLSQDASSNASSAAEQAAAGHDGASGPRRRVDGLPPAAALGSKRGASQGGAPAAAAGAADWPGAGTLPPGASSAPTGNDASSGGARRSPAAGLQPHYLLFADAGLALDKREPTPGLEGRECKRRDTTHSSVV